MTYDRRGGDDRRQGEEPEGTAASRDDEFAQYVADLSSRLRTVCSHLSDDEFNRLVTDIALMKVRFDEIEARPGALSPIRDQQTRKPS